MSKIYSRPRIKIPKVFVSKVGDKNFLKKRKMIIIIFIIIIAFSTTKIVLNAILPIFDKLCEEKAKSIATIISNEQATVVMSEHKYDELFSVEKDSNGNVTMIKSNVSPINEIISDVAIKIQNELDKKESDKIEIALGSFSGVKLIAGEGVKIPIKISSGGSVETDLRSEFTYQGINQTLHRVYLQVDCKVCIVTPYDSITTQISNQVLIAENVVVGRIPETYYNLEGIDSDNAIDVIE